MPDDASDGSRDPVSPAELASDIRLCLQMARPRAARDAVSREAFAAVAELIVGHFEDRGYEVTMRRPEPPRPAPDMMPSRRER